MADTWDDDSLDMNVVVLLRQLPNDEERQRLIDCLTYVHLRTKQGDHEDRSWDDHLIWLSTSGEPYSWHGHYFDDLDHRSSMLFE